MTSETKNCQNCKNDFIIEPDDFAFYEKIKVPPPTHCPDCRLQRRLAWRNMRSIYKRECGLCGKNTISIYSPDKSFTVYCSKCWWADGWDELEYGQEYNPDKPFFEQFNDLLHKTPLVARFGYETTAERSDYVNMFMDIKDCYLCFHIDNSERCLYCYHVQDLNDCNSLGYSYGNELCYFDMGIQQCNKVMYSQYSESCIDSWFLKNCNNCTNCFASSNLRNKQFYIFNEPYENKEAYETKLKELGFDATSYKSVQSFKQQAQDHWIKYPSKYMHGVQNNYATGDFVYNSKNTHHAFSVRDGDNIKYGMFLIDGANKDSMDWTQYGDSGELMYEVMAAGGGAHNCHFGVFNIKGCRNVDYNYLAVNSSECFGNVSIRNRKYCILNKQYSKKEYESLKDKIISKMKSDGEYGEFFPITMSPFGYNETTAQEEYPIQQSESTTKSFKWTDIESQKGKYSITMQATNLPDKINDVEDGILKQVIGCSKCSRAYQIVPAELQFHRSLELPLPRLCIDCRHDELMQWRNPFKLWQRKCYCAGLKSDKGVYSNTATSHQSHETDQHCSNEFETSYAPDRSEIVYCAECYQAEVA